MRIPYEISSRMATRSILSFWFSVILPYFLLLYNSLFISLPISLPTKINTSAIEDMANNRLVPVGLHPFVHILSVEILISAHQYNRSIVSAFAHSHVRMREIRACPLI